MTKEEKVEPAKEETQVKEANKKVSKIVKETEKVKVDKPDTKAVEDKKISQKTKKPEKDLVTANVAAPKKQAFKRRNVARAKAHILCSYNNTVVSISDLNGNVLGWASSGALGFKGPKKSTPFAATLVAQKVVEKTARYGIKEVEVFIKGVGGGREASVRALGNAGWLINSIKDITPVPHNGCRPKKPRRV